MVLPPKQIVLLAPAEFVGNGLTVYVMTLDVACAKHVKPEFINTLTVFAFARVDVVNVAFVAPVTFTLFTCH